MRELWIDDVRTSKGRNLRHLFLMERHKKTGEVLLRIAREHKAGDYVTHTDLILNMQQQRKLAVWLLEHAMERVP